MSHSHLPAYSNGKYPTVPGSRQVDMASLCPPPPLPSNVNQYSQSNIHHIQVQQSTNQHTNYGMLIAPGHYQSHQYHQYQQNIYNQHQLNHLQYSNHSFLLPPPPPPPPRPPPQSNNKIPNKSLQTSNAGEVKKINPKMVKKYAGRGLKTITISGPGMPTQKFRICVGNHPEDVQKWVEERRKRFPRQNRISEAAGLSDSVGKAMDVAAGEKKRGNDASYCANGESKKQCIDRSHVSKEDTSSKSGGALSSLLSGYESSSSHEDECAEILVDNTKLKTDSTSEEQRIQNSNGDVSIQHPVVPVKVNSPPTGATRICKFFKRGLCRHGDSCKFLHTNKPQVASEHREDYNRETQSERDKARKKREYELKVLGLDTPSRSHRNGNKPINRTSLLKKLLQRDKEREQRLTLQLLRYIVDCNFFQERSEAGLSENGNVEPNGEEGKCI